MTKYTRPFLFLLILAFSSAVFAHSTIITANSFSTVEKLLQKNPHPHQTLLVMDDDDTLTMLPCSSHSHCQYLGGPSWYTWQASLKKNNPDRVWKNYNQLFDICDFLYITNSMPLTDPKIITALKTVNKMGAHAIVETDRGYRMTYATEKQLQQDGILSLIEKSALKTPSGHTSFPAFYFPKAWGKQAPRRVTYLHGVTYVAGQNKGEILKQLLAKTDMTKKITHIIFIDDTLQNDKDVATVFKNDSHVSVIAIHYTRLAKIKSQFFIGKYAKKFQAQATAQWKAIRTVLKNNLLGYAIR